MDRFDRKKSTSHKRAPTRREQQNSARAGSEVKPGTRRIVSSWLMTGRIASLLLLIASVGGLMYVFTAPQFTVQDVRIEGAQIVDRAEVAKLADAEHQSIWFIDTQKIVKRIKTSAYIDQARAYVTLPDRLTITISERHPEVRWQTNGTRYLVDATGRVLGVDGTAPLSNTLVIEDLSNRVLQPNDQVDADALKLGSILALRLPKEMSLRPASIAWTTNTGIFVTTPDGRKVVFGQTKDLDNKLSVLRVLLQDKTPFTYLDLRPNTPFYRNDPGIGSQGPGTGEQSPTPTPGP